MNIQEAIKSGKPFKRPRMWDWLETEAGEVVWVIAAKRHIYSPTMDDILADDWEIKEDTK